MLNTGLWRTCAACILMAVGSTACVITPPAQKLSGVQVPAGSTLEMSRSVALAISTSDTALPAGTVGNLEVRRDDGSVIFEGPVFAKLPVTSSLVLPTSQSHLTAILHVAGMADATLAVAVDSGTATASFQ